VTQCDLRQEEEEEEKGGRGEEKQGNRTEKNSFSEGIFWILDT
jgi:hypothetical protein